MSPLHNHENIGSVQKTAYLTGVILAVYATDEKDFVGTPEESRIDTADIKVTIEDGKIFGLKIPLFYHCTHEAVERDNGALEGASSAFRVDDEVIVQCEITSAGHYKPLRVIGFTDRPKACAVWLEDWEGATITSNHPWESLAAWGSGCSGSVPDAALFTFGGEQVLKTESIITGGYYCTQQPYVELFTSPEIPLNLGNCSGFTCKAYLAEFEPRTFDKATCLGGCSLSWYIDAYVFLTLYWRPVGSSEDYTDSGSYGFRMGQSCYYDKDKKACVYSDYDPTYERWSTFIARIGSWSALPHFSDSIVPWGNSDYELTYIVPDIQLRTNDQTVKVHGTTNMKVYFSDIVIS